jgi:hypothetical protein
MFKTSITRRMSTHGAEQNDKLKPAKASQLVATQHTISRHASRPLSARKNNNMDTFQCRRCLALSTLLKVLQGMAQGASEELEDALSSAKPSQVWSLKDFDIGRPLGKGESRTKKLK